MRSCEIGIVDRGRRTDGRIQRSEIRCQRSGIELISDLRLLTSVMDGFYDLNGFDCLNELTNCLIDLNRK